MRYKLILMAREGDGIPRGYTDVQTGQKVFYEDDAAQVKYERRLQLLNVVRKSMAKRREGKLQPPKQQ